MTEVALRTLADYFGISDYLFKTDSHLLCSVIAPLTKEPVSHWNRILQSEITSTDGELTLSLIMAEVRTFIRVAIFDYERVADKNCCIHAILMEVIKASVVFLLAFYMQRAFVFVLGAAKPNATPRKDQTTDVQRDPIAQLRSENAQIGSGFERGDIG